MPVLTNLTLPKEIERARARIAAGAKRVPIQAGDGLLLIVQGKSAAWVIRRSLAGKRVDRTLGKYPEVSMREARRLAALQADEPAPAVELTPVARASAGSVEWMMEDWIKSQTISDVYEDNIRTALNANLLPTLGKKAPEAVTRADIDGVLRAIEERGALDLVRRVRMWLRQLWEFGIDSEKWPAVESNPVRQGQLKSFKAAKKGHFPAITDAAQVPKLMQVIRLTNSTITRHALLLSAYVWQRPGEIREATWDEFDLDAGKWVIPAARMKMKREHWVPLAPQVVDLLRLHQGLVGTEGYLFPGQKRGEPISEATVQKRLKDAGYKGIHTPHGFRAMARTIGEEVLGLEHKVLEKHLAHEPSDALRGAYNRAEFWPQRVEALAKWADWLDAQK